jgi:hypothetical protein
MTKLPKYVCITCGQGFTTARSGRRHIEDVEHGNGYITREADYRVLLLTGRIAPPIPKLIRPKKKEKNIIDIAQEEFIKGFYFRMGVQTYDENAAKPETTQIKNMLLTRTMQKLMK